MPRARLGTTCQPCRESVVAGTKAALPQAQQVVLAHQPQHALVIDRPALPPQLRADPPIAIVAVRQRQTLDGIAQAGLLLARRRGLPMPVIAGAADARERAHPLDREIALRLAGPSLLG